jgi:hypothetical protein
MKRVIYENQKANDADEWESVVNEDKLLKGLYSQEH